ncbi:Holliday junction resolvase RuvX [Spiroplasma eriocheiris]|uniref:Putative pre-16S rRNA nuclease n=1 Tax=Spiroplasma eriocheiris TaxID=315358 RepID=A0A0H3XHF2_9MOLU|nr:Holliday junction resolvase RuvX [Spiroplasma eriocheiris]AHF57660.1 Holliday junction resolvase [Spiroplasma eriocheiris CCTCC M 207170]AKM54113.1 Holliday junction resolvase-like protein [Spiroplasma eriocheiris]
MNNYYLALDVGSKTIGLASSRGVIATPRGVLRFPEGDFLQAAIQVVNLITTENFSHLIVGYPKNMNNTIGPRAEMVEEFIKILKTKLGDLIIPIILVDERLTTHQSHQIMLEANLSRAKRKQKKDSLAAQLILETYLSNQK